MEWLQMFREACWDVREDDEVGDDCFRRVDLVAQVVECYVDRMFAQAWPGGLRDPGPCAECGAGCMLLLE